jgi:hypothetical protein
VMWCCCWRQLAASCRAAAASTKPFLKGRQSA